MIVGVTVCELHLPRSRSLKEKRRVIRPLIERLHQRYRISIAETDYQNLHQRAEISMAIVGTSETEIRRSMDELRRIIDQEPEAFLSQWCPDILESSATWDSWGDVDDGSGSELDDSPDIADLVDRSTTHPRGDDQE